MVYRRNSKLFHLTFEIFHLTYLALSLLQFHSLPSSYIMSKYNSTSSTWNPMLFHHSPTYICFSFPRILFSHSFGKLLDSLQTSLKCPTLWSSLLNTVSYTLSITHLPCTMEWFFMFSYNSLTTINAFFGEWTNTQPCPEQPLEKCLYCWTGAASSLVGR